MNAPSLARRRPLGGRTSSSGSSRSIGAPGLGTSWDLRRDMEEEARRAMVTSVPDRRPMSQTSLAADVGCRVARAIGGEGVEPQKNSGFRVAAGAGRRLLVGGKDCVARASTPSRNEVVQRGPRSSKRVQSRKRSKPETFKAGNVQSRKRGGSSRAEPYRAGSGRTSAGPAGSRTRPACSSVVPPVPPSPSSSTKRRVNPRLEVGRKFFGPPAF